MKLLFQNVLTYASHQNEMIFICEVSNTSNTIWLQYKWKDVTTFAIQNYNEEQK